MRLQFGGGIVQRLQWRTGQFELSGRFQRNCRIALLQADGVAAVDDRRAALGMQPLEQAANRAGLPIGWRVWRNRIVGKAKAELLVLGANTELRRRLAAGGN